MAPEVLNFLWVPAVGAYEEEQIFEVHKRFEFFKIQIRRPTNAHI
jgi:hypothetical protein